jgi:hypothetical protein
MVLLLLLLLPLTLTLLLLLLLLRPLPLTSVGVVCWLGARWDCAADSAASWAARVLTLYCMSAMTCPALYSATQRLHLRSRTRNGCCVRYNDYFMTVCMQHTCRLFSLATASLDYDWSHAASKDAAPCCRGVMEQYIRALSQPPHGHKHTHTPTHPHTRRTCIQSPSDPSAASVVPPGAAGHLHPLPYSPM